MKKIRLSSYYIILFMFLQVFGVFTGVRVLAEEGGTLLTDEQRGTIVDHCDAMKDNLKLLQRTDSRARVYLGRYYETILTNFITPLNVRLVDNNLSNAALIDNQANFSSRRTRFVNDYISYQQELEELVNTDCKNNPDEFYENLLDARATRAVVNRDVMRLREFAGQQVKLVEELKNGL